MPHFVDDYLAYLLAKCSHVVSSSFHAQLKEQGIPVNTWRILGSINDEPRTVGQLVGLVLISQPTLSKALDRLERDGLITRKQDDKHRRQVYIHITDTGQNIVNKLIPLANEDESKSFKHMPEEDKKQLKRLLHELVEYHSK